MTGRAAAVQGGLAVLGLITAHLTWQREPEHTPGEVTIFDATKYDVTRVRYEDESGSAEMERVKTGDGPEVFLRVAHTPPRPLEAKNAKDAKDAKKTTASNPPETPPARALRGSEAAQRVYDKFTPFVAPRAFGVVEAAKLKELGLDAAKRKLVITVRGDTRSFDIGKPAASPTGEMFLRDARDGRVYLFPRGILPEMQNADTLIDRRLHTFEPADYDRIAVAVGGKRKDFVHVGQKAPATEGFAPAKTPDKPDQMAKNWHDTLWRTFPMDVLGKGESPKDGTPAVAFRVDYYSGKDTPVGWVEVAKLEAAGAKTLSEEHESPTDLYARTEHTVGWVKLRAGSQLVADAVKLVAN